MFTNPSLHKSHLFICFTEKNVGKAFGLTHTPRMKTDIKKPDIIYAIKAP